MSILEKHIAFVNDQIAFQGKMIQKFDKNPFRKSLHEATQGKFRSLAADLAEADKVLDEAAVRPLSSPGQANSGRLKLALTPEDIEGLPDDVLKELSISDADKTEFAILGLMEEAGGIMSLDHLIIGLFKKTGEKHKRQTLTSRLYRMAQKEQVFSVPSRKGVYSSRQVSEEEAEKLTGG